MSLQSVILVSNELRYLQNNYKIHSTVTHTSKKRRKSPNPKTSIATANLAWRIKPLITENPCGDIYAERPSKKVKKGNESKRTEIKLLNNKEKKPSDLDLISIKEISKYFGPDCTQIKVLNLNKFEDINRQQIELISQQFSNLTRLSLSNCEINEIIQYMGEIPTLTHLDLSYTNVVNLNGLELPNLISLNLKETPIETLNGIMPLCTLNKIILKGCKYLTNVEAIQYFPYLKYFNINRCKSIKSLDALKKLTNIFYLKMGKCCKPNVDFLENLTNLQHLDIRECPQFDEHDILKNMTKLKYLNISGNARDANKMVVSDEREGYKTIDSMSFLQGLDKLTFLSCNNCNINDSLVALGKLTSLMHLSLGDCNLDGKLEPLTNLANLRVLDLSKTSLPEPDFLDDLPKLIQFFHKPNLNSMTLEPHYVAEIQLNEVS